MDEQMTLRLVGLTLLCKHGASQRARRLASQDQTTQPPNELPRRVRSGASNGMIAKNFK